MTTLVSKPVRRKVRIAGMPHGIRPDLVIALYPGGIIGLREVGRRREYQVAAGVRYARLVGQEARRAR